jgi:hypothetical protein
MDRNDAAAFDARLRQALRRERTTLTVAASGLVAVCMVLLAIGADLLAVAGLVLLTAFVVVMALDSWRRRPRPPARLGTVHGNPATVLMVSRVPLIGAAVAAAGLLLLIGSVLVGEGIADTVDGRRGGFLLYAAVPLAPILFAVAVALAVRPSYIAAAADGIEVRAHGRTRATTWDSIDSIGPLEPAAGGQLGGGLTLSVTGAGQRQTLPTRHLSATLWVLAAWLQHYVDTPRDRAELGTPAAVQRLAMLESDMTEPSLKPAWFPPPASSRAMGSDHV